MNQHSGVSVSETWRRIVKSRGNSFSWGGWRDDVWIQCRLDRSFGNDQWFQLFPRSSVEYMNLWVSDYRPIRTCFALEGEEPGQGRFYFDKRLVKKEVVRRGWCGAGTDNLSIMEPVEKFRDGRNPLTLTHAIRL